MIPKLTAAEVLQRLHLTRQVLGSILATARIGAEPVGEPWRSGQEVLKAIAVLQQYAERRLHRADVAAYAADVSKFAQHVFAEMLAQAPAVSDQR